MEAIIIALLIIGGVAFGIGAICGIPPGKPTNGWSIGLVALGLLAWILTVLIPKLVHL
jgi:VIT1/CCC1 family predicted Fe2+/Mn2+ transporter